MPRSRRQASGRRRGPARRPARAPTPGGCRGRPTRSRASARRWHPALQRARRRADPAGARGSGSTSGSGPSRRKRELALDEANRQLPRQHRQEDHRPEGALRGALPGAKAAASLSYAKGTKGKPKPSPRRRPSKAPDLGRRCGQRTRASQSSRGTVQATRFSWRTTSSMRSALVSRTRARSTSASPGARRRTLYSGVGRPPRDAFAR
jgi:hypothetical protein